MLIINLSVLKGAQFYHLRPQIAPNVLTLQTPCLAPVDLLDDTTGLSSFILWAHPLLFCLHGINFSSEARRWLNSVD